LIKEEESVGKGADAVISLVHNYFKLHGLGEKKLIIHADNCAGQNKNNAMVMYLAWRVMNNFHEEITYSFMVAGHTKFSPDSFFGLLKLKLQKSEVDNLDDLVQVVEDSTVSKHNLSQTIFDKEGNRIVHFYSWTKFLTNYFKSVPHILKQHHFVFSKDNIGSVEIRETIDGERQLIEIRKDKTMSTIAGFPQEIKPSGLSNERRWYLYEQVRPHIQDPNKQDDLCPKPVYPKLKIKRPINLAQF
jgi:hypothetical protein